MLAGVRFGSRATRILAAIALGIGAAAALWFVSPLQLRESARNPGVGSEAPAARADAAAAVVSARPAVIVPDVRPIVPAGSREPLPEFLRNVPVDGGLDVDAAGHFVPSVNARHLFQHFFLAAGKEPDDVIRGRIALEIAGRLPPAAAAEALAALDRFVALRAKLAAIEWEADPRRRFERTHELRRQLLGPELAEAFYGEDERTIEVEFALRALDADAALSAAERARRRAEVETALPARVREARQASRAPLEVQAEVERMRAGGASAEEIFTVREQQFGRAAAERLAAYDAERSRWEDAWKAYRGARNALLETEPGLSENDASLERLRRSYFREGDLARVRALDHAEAFSRATR